MYYSRTLLLPPPPWSRVLQCLPHNPQNILLAFPIPIHENTLFLSLPPLSPLPPSPFCPVLLPPTFRPNNRWCSLCKKVREIASSIRYLFPPSPPPPPASPRSCRGNPPAPFCFPPFFSCHSLSYSLHYITLHSSSTSCFSLPLHKRSTKKTISKTHPISKKRKKTPNCATLFLSLFFAPRPPTLCACGRFPFPSVSPPLSSADATLSSLV